MRLYIYENKINLKSTNCLNTFCKSVFYPYYDGRHTEQKCQKYLIKSIKLCLGFPLICVRIDMGIRTFTCLNCFKFDIPISIKTLAVCLSSKNN